MNFVQIVKQNCILENTNIQMEDIRFITVKSVVIGQKSLTLMFNHFKSEEAWQSCEDAQDPTMLQNHFLLYQDFQLNYQSQRKVAL